MIDRPTAHPRIQSCMRKSARHLALVPTYSFVFAALVVLAMPTAPRAETPLSQRGLHLAELHCARCHVVSEKTRGGGISSTPSFMILIKALKDWRDRFESFHARRPHPAHIRFENDDERPEHLPATIEEVVLTIDDLEALLAYADALAAEQK